MQDDRPATTAGLEYGEMTGVWRVRARLNPAPAKSDDESESVDDVIDRHAQAINQTFIVCRVQC